MGDSLVFIRESEAQARGGAYQRYNYSLGPHGPTAAWFDMGLTNYGSSLGFLTELRELGHLPMQGDFN